MNQSKYTHTHTHTHTHIYIYIYFIDMKVLCFKIFAFYGQKGYSENYTMSYKLKCGFLSCFA